MVCMYTTMEYCSAINKEWDFTNCISGDGFGGHYATWNKSEKDKHYMIQLICEILKIKQTSEYNKKRMRYADREDKLVVTSGKRKVGKSRDRGLRGTDSCV